MNIHTLTVGEMQTNCYLLEDPVTSQSLIIDPGEDADYISTEILRLKLKPQAILLTHGHFDHALAALELSLNFNLSVYLNPKDYSLYQKAPASVKYYMNISIPSLPSPKQLPDKISLNQINIKVIPTPGHTQGSVCFHSAPHLFAGDTIFKDGVGRTDFPYSSPHDLQKSLKKILSLPSNTQIHPGHGESFLMNSLKQ